MRKMILLNQLKNENDLFDLDLMVSRSLGYVDLVYTYLPTIPTMVMIKCH